MWILPKQLHTSPFVLDTEALISDSDEFSQLCAQSLTARGKDSAARIWSAKLKRDSWMQLLFGRTLRPSHGSSFVDAWTSSLAATRASRSQPLASDSAPKTHDTSGRLSQPELLQCDQVAVSLRTSRDISALGFPTCCKTWQDWVTERRGAYSARVKLARLTKERGSLFWPSVVASEVRQGFQDRSRGMKGSQESLTTAVVKDAANWLTPQSGDVTGSTREAVVMWANGQRPKTSDQRLRTQVAAEQLKHGQADPASSNTSGSRQGLWLTPRANEPTGDSTFVTRNGDRGQHCSPSLTIQVEKTAQWATPRTPTGGPETAKRKQELGRTLSGGGDLASQANGRLNSQWVTQLMGLPLGFVSPSCPASVIKNWPRFVSGWSALTIELMSCDSSAMESCRPPQSELSEFSLASWPSPRAGESQQTEELSRLWVENGFKQPKTRGGKARANGSTFDVTLETAARGVAAMEAKP
jgi:hypothetical protein